MAFGAPVVPVAPDTSTSGSRVADKCLVWVRFGRTKAEFKIKLGKRERYISRGIMK